MLDRDINFYVFLDDVTYFFRKQLVSRSVSYFLQPPSEDPVCSTEDFLQKEEGSDNLSTVRKINLVVKDSFVALLKLHPENHG